MSEADDLRSLRIERTFNASAEKVFAAWLSPEVLQRWWHAEHEWETPLAEVDARVGGVIRLVMRNPSDGVEYGGAGEFTLIDPPRRLAFTWTWDSDLSRQQLIELEFIAQGDQTTVVMTHSGLPEKETEEYRDGWQASFDNLDVALAA